jgi:nucleobase:cation symporter-1, NCS1 family
MYLLPFYSRYVLAGIQGANGAQCITLMLLAIAPSYANIPNTLPESAGITSQGMVSYFLFWIIQLPLLLIPPTKLRWLFIIKIVAAPITALATMGWCVHQAGGSGQIFQLQATLTGSTKAWR